MPNRFALVAFVPSILLTACGSEPAAPGKPPVHSEAIAHETELVRLKLTPETQKRLWIVTERIGTGTASAVRMTSGEIVIPAGVGGAPIYSASNLQQLAAQQVAADGELARARAQLALARVAYDRPSTLVDEEAGSIRARDEATAALGAAKAAADAAAAQRRLLGPAVASLGTQRHVWVRVPVFGSDLAGLQQGQGRWSRRLDRKVPSDRRGPSMRRHLPMQWPAPSISISRSIIVIGHTASARGSASRSRLLVEGAKGCPCRPLRF